MGVEFLGNAEATLNLEYANQEHKVAIAVRQSQQKKG